jgi:CLIP-associating protein 1/2
VQADAAHTAVKKMMRACHVGKLVKALSDNLIKSKNAKLRLACIDFFHVVLESWLKPEYEHYIGNFEAGLKSALSDASKEVRAKAREAFVMYRSQWPENASALFDGLSSSTQKAIGQTGKKNKTAMQSSSRQSIRSKILKSNFAAQLADSETNGDQKDVIVWPKKEESHSLHEEKVLGDRGDNAGGSASSEEQTKNFPSGATRISRDDTLQASLSKSRNSDGGSSERAPLEKKENYASPRSNENGQKAKRKLNAFSVKRYLESVGTKSLPWNVKVEMNGNFQEWISQQGQAIVTEVSAEMEKLVFSFVDHFNDPHHKVALSSLALFDQLLPLCLHLLEPYVVKFCPPLFLKMVDNKEQVRASASEILMTMGERYSVDTLIPALSRSLKSNRHPRSRIAALEFSVKYFRKNTTTSAYVLEGWVALIGPLICEKVVEVRRAAAAAMVRIYQSVNAEPVLAYILSLAPSDQSVVRKAVHTFVGSIDAELASYAASQNIHNLSWHDKAAEVGEKRQSVESVPIDLEYSAASPTEAPLTTSEDCAMDLELPAETESHEPQSSPTSYGNFLQKTRQLEAEEKGSKSPSFALREKPFNVEMPDNSPDVEMHDLELILNNLGKCNLKQDYALKQFSTLSRKYPSSVWEVFCEETISKLLNYVRSSSPGVKAGGLLSVKEFAQSQPQLISNALGDILSLVMGAVNEAHLEVKQSADECLLALAQGSNVELFVELVLDNLPAHMEDSSRKRALVSIFRSLGKALANLPLPELTRKLGDVLPYLFTSFSSTDADVRKAVVFCLVDIYAGMGNMLMPHLSPLSTAQLKLLTIYIQRSKKSSVYKATNGKENSAPNLSQLNPVYN